MLIPNRAKPLLPSMRPARCLGMYTNSSVLARTNCPGFKVYESCSMVSHRSEESQMDLSSCTEVMKGGGGSLNLVKLLPRPRSIDTCSTQAGSMGGSNRRRLALISFRMSGRDRSKIHQVHCALEQS